MLLSTTSQRQTLLRKLTLFLMFIGVQLIAARASEPVIWTIDSRSEMLKGEARGVSISDAGALTLAPRFTEVFNTEQAYIWSEAIDGAGNIYLGTGHDGRIYRVAPDGRGALLTDTAELDVTALAIGRDGALYAGTSPEGKVYRITPDGRAETYFDPPDKYIWSLAVMNDGALAIGTGENGKIYRVRAAGTKPEDALLIDVAEAHIISLEIDARGQLIAGTDPGGLVLRITSEGKAFALFDAPAPLREIHALATAPDGAIYALALSDAASVSRFSASPLPAPGASGASGSAVTVTVTPIVDDAGIAGASGGAAPAGRSRNDLSSARSALFRLSPDGNGADILWSSNTVTAFSVIGTNQDVLLGTSDKGRVYSVMSAGRDKLLLQSSEDQIAVLKSRGKEVYAASSNQGKLFRLTGEAVAEGFYESSVRDANLVASWGRIWWRGSGKTELQTRTGNTERPDATWSDWSTPYRDAQGSAISSPRARFIQWRAVLRSSATSGAAVEDVNLAYLPRNVAPEVVSVAALPAGVGLQPALQTQVDPNIESSGLNPALFGSPSQVPPRRIYQRGAVSLQWQAEDRNRDTLEYAVYYRAINEANFHLLKDKVRDNFYTVDGAALADGKYVFKIVASDVPDNPSDRALTGERTSEPFDVDNTPPLVRALDQPQDANGRVRVRFAVEDALGMVKRAEISVDGGEWRSIFPEDGIADSPRETYLVEASLVATGEHTISLRAFDGVGNIGSARVVVRR